MSFSDEAEHRTWPLQRTRSALHQKRPLKGVMRAMSTTTRAVIGDLSIQMIDGTVLRSHTDVDLAKQWAKYVHGNVWDHLTYGQQCQATSEALAELRRTLTDAEGEK